MLLCFMLFILCTLVHDRFGKTAEKILVRFGVTLIVLWVVCGVAVLLNLIDCIL